ncbi:MAG TPA: hypothetical protein VGB83_04560 [Actinomycetota bacterium]
MKRILRAASLVLATAVVLGLAAPANAAVTDVAFDGTDTTTGGNWSFTNAAETTRTYQYGSFAYALPNSIGQFEYEVGGDNTSQPSLDETGGMGFGDEGYTGEQAAYRVHGPLGDADPRALMLPSGTERRPTACYGPTVSTSLTLPAGNYRVAVYILDWDRNGRIQTTLTASDGDTATNTVIDALNGVYQLFDVHSNGIQPVTIASSIDAGPNAVISGVFVDALGAPVVGSTWSGLDTTTQGNWVGVYGATGYLLCGMNTPTGAALGWTSSLDVASGLVYSIAGNTYAWADAFAVQTVVEPAYAFAWTGWSPEATGDARYATFWKYNSTTGGAATPGDRRATTWDSYDEVAGYTRPLVVDLHLPANSDAERDGFKLALYFLDFEGYRAQDLVIRDVTRGVTLPTEHIANFQGGIYYRYVVPAGTDLEITLTKTAGQNAVLSGIFLDELSTHGDGGTPPDEPPVVNEPRTPGYWGNWSNHFTQAQFQAILDAAIAQCPAFAGTSVKQATDKLRADAWAMSDKLAQHFLAFCLNIADRRLNPNTHVDLTRILGALTVFGDDTRTVEHIRAKVQFKWDSQGTPWKAWSRMQQEIAKNVLDAINNDGSGLLMDVEILL